MAPLKSYMSGMVAKAFGRDRKNKTLTIDIETLGSTKTSSPMPPSPTTLSSPPTSVPASASSTQDIKKPLVLVRGTKERPGFVQATVTLELDSSTEGDEVEIIFKAVIGSKVPIQGALWENESRSEQILQQKRWVMPVRKAGAKTIAAGIYKHQVFTTIDHSWPSSCTTQPEGFVQYMFQAQIMATTHAAPLLSTTQEFLVINHHPTTQPTAPSTSLYSWGRNHSSVVPHSTLVVSPKKSLPVQVSIPSETLMFGQGVPITIDVYPFKEDSSFAGQEAVIMEARFRVQEVRHARSSNHTIKDRLVKDVVELRIPGTLMGSWPQGRNGWKRTVTVKMPYSTLEPNPPSLPSVTSKRSSLSSTLSAVSTSSTGSSASNSSRSEKTRTSKKSQPFLRASLRSRYYDVTHQLLIGLKIRTSGEKDKQAEDVEIRLDFKLAYPQPDGTDELPEYHPVAAFSFDGDEFLPLPLPLPLPLTPSHKHPYSSPLSRPCPYESQRKSTRRETFAGKILQPLRV